MTRLSARFDFPGAAGNLLSGRLELPAGRPSAVALFAHCFTCTKETFAPARISRALAERGIATLRFDFTGLGGSEGDFGNAGFSSNVGDLVAAARALAQRLAPPAVLIGHSFGGAAVLAAAGDLPEARLIATIAAPAEPRHVTHLFEGSLAEIRARGEAVATIAGRSFRLSRGFLDDIEGQALAPRIEALGRPLLVFHAPDDTIVALENGEQIFAAARQPKSFVALEGASHLLPRHEDASFVAEHIAAWVRRHLGTEAGALAGAPGGAEPDPTLGETVTVEETGEGRYANVIRARTHFLAADEPRRVGGMDTGPSPYELLLAALGACTSITLRMYADRKGIGLKRLAVQLSHAKVHAADCAECEGREGLIDRITRDLIFEGDLSVEQVARLREIADKCPVHRTLEGRPVIVTRVAGG